MNPVARSPRSRVGQQHTRIRTASARGGRGTARETNRLCLFGCRVFSSTTARLRANRPQKREPKARKESTSTSVTSERSTSIRLDLIHHAFTTFTGTASAAVCLGQLLFCCFRRGLRDCQWCKGRPTEVRDYRNTHHSEQTSCTHDRCFKHTPGPCTPV